MLILALIAASAIGVGVMTANIANLNATHEAASARAATDNDNRLRLVRLRDDLRYQVIQVQQFLTDVSATRGQNGLDDGFEEAENHADGFTRDMQNALQLSRTLHEARIVTALEAVEDAFPGYYDTGKRMAHAYVAAGPSAGNALMPEFDAGAAHLDEQLQALDTAFQAYEASLQERAAADARDRTMREMLSIAIAIVVGLVNISAGVAVLIMLGRRLLGPVSRAVYALKRLTEGDNTVALDGGERNDEMGDMARAVRSFRDAAIERIRLEQEATQARHLAEKERLEREEERLMAARRQLEQENQAASARKEAESAARLEQERQRQQQLQREGEAARLAADEARREIQEQHAELEAERIRNENAVRAAAEEQAAVVQGLARALDALANGDLTANVSDEMTGEYQKLKDDFNAAVAKLHETVARVTRNVARIHAATGEIANGAENLAHRTEQQAANLEETTASLDEITTTITKTAASAKEAASVVSMAHGDALASGDVVKRAVAAMREIQTSATQINQIIGVIDEIAFQTNLLALNAGVEAARAGEAGRGFAVVASEVRALAQRSAQSAKEIKALISMSSSQVSEGSDLVAQTGDSLLRIIEHVTKIDTVVGEIAASAQAQAGGINELNSAVNEIDRSTQQNAAMVEQTRTATRALGQEAADLANLVKVFRLKTGALRGVQAAA